MSGQRLMRPRRPPDDDDDDPTRGRQISEVVTGLRSSFKYKFFFSLMKIGKNRA